MPGPIIELTDFTTKTEKVYLSILHINAITTTEAASASIVTLTSGALYWVTETPAEIIALVKGAFK